MQKKKRIQNRTLINEIKFNSRCVICFAIPCDVDHVRSRGSGGHDIKHNLLALCRACHTERHKIGLTQLSKKYWRVREWLEERGWEFDEASQKWRYVLNWEDGV